MLKTRPLLAYVLIAYGWTWLVTLPLLLSRRGVVPWDVSHAFEVLGAFGPFIAAWLVMRATGTGAEFVARLGRWRIGAGWWSFTVLTPVAFLVLAIVGTALIKGEPPGIGGFATSGLATTGGFVELLVVGAFLQSLGEEPGWRGFMTPKLRERRGPLATSLILFPVWLFWHLPFFLSRPEFGIGQFVGFSLGILSASMWLTLLWDHTRSSLVAIVWHTLLNLTRNIALAVSMAAFLAYGLVVMAGAAGIVGWWLFRRRPPPPATTPAGTSL